MSKETKKTITAQIDRGLADNLPHIAMLYGYRSINAWVEAIIEEKVREVDLGGIAKIYNELQELKQKG